MVILVEIGFNRKERAQEALILVYLPSERAVGGANEN